MMNQEFNAQGTKFHVLPKFGVLCKELRGLRVTSFRAWMHSFCFAAWMLIISAVLISNVAGRATIGFDRQNLIEDVFLRSKLWLLD